MKVSEQELCKYVLEILIENGNIKEGEKLPLIQLDTDLSSVGMDSILFIQLIVLLETSYSIEIDDEDLLIEHFSTINKIVHTLEKYEKETI